MMLEALQHHVAITLIRSAHLGRAHHICRTTCAGLVWQHKSKRWQSTTAKEIPAPFDAQPPTNKTEIPAISQPPANKTEIPATCFVDSPMFPEPGLAPYHISDDVDLATTRPADIDSPSPLDPGDYPDRKIPFTARVKYYFRLGKSYVMFFKTGTKNVMTNSKRYRVIQRKLQRYRLNTVAKYGGETVFDKQLPVISRSEYQMCIRTRHDLFKMVPFCIVLLICGEFTPFAIIVLGSSIVPYTCRIPRQEQKDWQKKSKKDQQYMEDLPRLHPDIETTLETPNWRVEHVEAYRLGLTVFRAPLPILGPMIHRYMTRPRLIQHCEQLVSDTILIQRQGGPSKLSYKDIFEWADAYGLYALRQYVNECQKKGEYPKTEKAKTALLPKVDAEMKYMRRLMKDWTRLKYEEQWRVGLRTIGSRSPDWQARVKEIRKNWTQA